MTDAPLGERRAGERVRATRRTHADVSRRAAGGGAGHGLAGAEASTTYALEVRGLGDHARSRHRTGRRAPRPASASALSSFTAACCATRCCSASRASVSAIASATSSANWASRSSADAGRCRPGCRGVDARARPTGARRRAPDGDALEQLGSSTSGPVRRASAPRRRSARRPRRRAARSGRASARPRGPASACDHMPGHQTRSRRPRTARARRRRRRTATPPRVRRPRRPRRCRAVRRPTPRRAAGRPASRPAADLGRPRRAP